MKKNLIKNIFIGIVTIFLLYLVYNNLDLRKKINLDEKNKNYLVYRLNLLDREKEIQRKLIGTKIVFNGIDNFRNSSTKKLVFFYNQLGNEKSLFDALKYYLYLFQTKKINSKIRLIVIIPTKSLSYIKSLSLQFPKQAEFFPDTSLKFSRRIGLLNNDNAVLLLTESLKCLYIYLLEIDNPLRDIDESPLIIKYINFNSLK